MVFNATDVHPPEDKMSELVESERKDGATEVLCEIIYESATLFARIVRCLDITSGPPRRVASD